MMTHKTLAVVGLGFMCILFGCVLYNIINIKPRDTKTYNVIIVNDSGVIIREFKVRGEPTLTSTNKFGNKTYRSKLIIEHDSIWEVNFDQNMFTRLEE